MKIIVAGGLFDVSDEMKGNGKQETAFRFEKHHKGTLSIISIDPLCKDDNDWFTTLPLTYLSRQ